MRTRLLRVALIRWMGLLAGLFCATVAMAAEPGRPRVIDNTLRSSTGQILRGDHLFLTGTTGNTRGDEFTLKPSAWKENAATGFNLRRLWASGAEPNDEAKFRRINRCVELAAQAGQYVIILYAPNDPKARLPPGSAHHKEFWGIAAARYKNRTHVIYELYNEPEDAWQIDRDERPGYTGGVPMARLVRDLAPDTPIILFGNNQNPRAPSYYQEFQDGYKARYGVDWSWGNSLIGFHGYYNATAAQMQAVKERWPCINTEAPSYYRGDGQKTAYGQLVYAIEDDWDAIVRMEKLGIAWCYFNHVTRTPYGEPAPAGYRWVFADFDAGPFADHMVKNGVAWWTPGPAVSITAPEASSSFTAPAKLTITASVLDKNGTIKRVEFYRGATKLGQSAAPPYAFTWNEIKAGAYSLVAKVIDNSGAAHASYPVKISVLAGGMSKAAITNATAGAEEKENSKANSYDGQANTRWAANASLSDAWIVYDLGNTQTVATVKLRLFNGRILAYPIKIEVGDGTKMTQVWNGTTEWWEKTAQSFDVADTPGRYVKVSLTGNNSHDNAYFSIYETEIYFAASRRSTGARDEK